MRFQANIKSLDGIVIHLVQNIVVLVFCSYKCAVWFGGNNVMKERIMTQDYLLVLTDAGIHFQRGYTKTQCLEHSRDGILWHQAAAAAVALFIEGGN